MPDDKKKINVSVWARVLMDLVAFRKELAAKLEGQPPKEDHDDRQTLPNTRRAG